MESTLLEKLMIKACLIDPNFVATLSSVFQKEYFDNTSASRLFEYINKHFIEYGQIPPILLILSDLDKNNQTDISDYLSDIDTIDFNYVQHYDVLFNETNEYLKEQAIKKAILSSVNIINQKDDKSLIRKLIEDAMSKDLKVDIGLNYFNTLGERLTRLMGSGDIRVPSGFPTLDEYINGGFPPYTLSVILAKIHGFKSSFLANMSARQVLLGHNVGLATLEMSEDAFAQRFDSIFSLLDINKLYRVKTVGKKLINKLTEVKNLEHRGELIIKQYPTGKASVSDYRKWIRELLIRGIKLSVFVCDYINLMKSEYKSKGDMYSDVKSIAEELRALSFEFKIPVISVSQLNRDGMKVSFDEVDFTYISESTGVAAASDFLAIFGSDEDKASYENELFYKIVKNRLGGRVGEISKFYHDTRNLKMYDITEEEMWLGDIITSQDERKIIERVDPIVRGRSNRSRRNG